MTHKTTDNQRAPSRRPVRPTVTPQASAGRNHGTGRAIRRLRIIEGQVRGLQKLVAEDTYCVDVLHQSLAIKEALSSFEDHILEKHLSTHVVGQIKSGKSAKAVREILSIYRLSKRK